MTKDIRWHSYLKISMLMSWWDYDVIADFLGFTSCWAARRPEFTRTNNLALKLITYLSSKLLFLLEKCTTATKCDMQYWLRWLVGLKLIQLERQKTQLPVITLAKNLKPILCRAIKGTYNSLNWKLIICVFKLYWRKLRNLT